MRPPFLLIAAGLAFSGCAAPAAAPVAEGGVTVLARIAAARTLLVPTPSVYDLDDVDNAQVTLFQTGVTPAVASTRVEAEDFDQPITFARLAASTGYRIEVQAWKDTERDTRVDDLAGDPGSCTTPFTTGTGASQDLGKLKLKLQDTDFSAETGDLFLDITPGIVLDGPPPGLTTLPAEDLAR